MSAVTAGEHLAYVHLAQQEFAAHRQDPEHGLGLEQHSFLGLVDLLPAYAEYVAVLETQLRYARAARERQQTMIARARIDESIKQQEAMLYRVDSRRRAIDARVHEIAALARKQVL